MTPYLGYDSQHRRGDARSKIMPTTRCPPSMFPTRPLKKLQLVTIVQSPKDLLPAMTVWCIYLRWRTLYTHYMLSMLTSSPKVSVSLILAFSGSAIRLYFVGSRRLLLSIYTQRVELGITHSCDTRWLCTSRRQRLAAL